MIKSYVGEVGIRMTPDMLCDLWPVRPSYVSAITLETLEGAMTLDPYI